MNKEAVLNPIIQDTKKGKLRYVPYGLLCGAHGVVMTLALRVQILPLAKPGKLRGVSANVGEPQREGRNQWLDRYCTGRCGVECSVGARV